jgi:Fe-S cluster biogenesis protein NfuA
MPEEENAQTLEERVSKILEEEIRPALRMDGGDIQLVGVEGTEVRVQLRGACAGCPGAQMTLRMGVERHLKERVPEVESVVAV